MVALGFFYARSVGRVRKSTRRVLSVHVVSANQELWCNSSPGCDLRILRTWLPSSLRLRSDMYDFAYILMCGNQKFIEYVGQSWFVFVILQWISRGTTNLLPLAVLPRSLSIT